MKALVAIAAILITTGAAAQNYYDDVIATSPTDHTTYHPDGSMSRVQIFPHGSRREVTERDNKQTIILTDTRSHTVTFCDASGHCDKPIHVPPRHRDGPNKR